MDTEEKQRILNSDEFKYVKRKYKVLTEEEQLNRAKKLMVASEIFNNIDMRDIQKLREKKRPLYKRSSFGKALMFIGGCVVTSIFLGPGKEYLKSKKLEKPKKK